MTGIERLRKLAGDYKSLSTKQAYIGINTRREADLLDDIADQIEREQEALVRGTEDVAGRDGDALAWVEEHGGLEAVKAHWSGRVALSHVHNMAERHKAKVARMQRHIEHVQGVCKTRAHRIVEMNKTIAEMRPRLMPEDKEWPRYKDGAPVNFDDAVVDAEDFDFKVKSFEFHPNGFTLHGEFDESHWYEEDDRLDYPAPKALDADGVEIREKCDVWWICEGDERGVHAERLRVETIGPNGLVECSPYNGGTWVYLEPSELYVNEPILAVDDKPLREGETVYGIGWTKHRFVVRAASDYEEDEPDGRFCVPCIDKDDGDEECWCDPSQLTHERPDSWERLEEDVTLSVERYRELYGIKKNDGMTWPQLVREDLVRRAKALAGVSE